MTCSKPVTSLEQNAKRKGSELCRALSRYHMFEGNVLHVFLCHQRVSCPRALCEIIYSCTQASRVPQASVLPLRKGSSGCPAASSLARPAGPGCLCRAPLRGQGWAGAAEGALGRALVPGCSEPSLCLLLAPSPRCRAGGYQPHLQEPQAPETSFRTGCLDKSHSISSEIPILM